MTIVHSTETVSQYEDLATADHEQIVFCRDGETGLRAIIAIHNTRLGPALGGTRFFPYASEAQAITDVLRLSEGMTSKAAAAGIALGGGKAVIIGDPATDKTPELLRAYGRFVDRLSGWYYTAADVGTTAEDLDVIATETRYVTGTNSGSGDSGFSTASGVFTAMQAAARHRWGNTGLAGKRVGVEGVGKVGARLVKLLLEAGAEVVITDASDEAVTRVLHDHAGVIALNSVIDAPVDVYAPCALGATLNLSSVDALRAELVCGAANNQLANTSVAATLAERGIIWIPDYVANAGGLIQVNAEVRQLSDDQVRKDIAGIGHTVEDILERAAMTGSTPSEVAATIVAERLAAAGHHNT